MLTAVLTSLLDGLVMAERYGSGEAHTIALHGWARSRHDWAPVFADRDGLALDLPGFGASAPPEDAWSTADYAAALAPLLDDTPKVIVGHSFGGRVAVHVAQQHPDRVAGLVLTGVPLLRAELGSTNRGKPAWAYRVARWLNQRGIVSEARMEAMREKYGSADYRAAQGVMRQILVKAVNEDYTTQLDAINAAGIPVRMVWGENDTAAPAAMARNAATRLGAAAKLTVVPGSAHLLDDALVRALRDAIADLEELKGSHA